MSKSIKDVMTPEPKVLPLSANVTQAAECMRDDDIGDVVVVDKEGKLYGIVTDRDIVIRVLAKGDDPSKVNLESIATKDVAVLAPSATLPQAIRVMREQTVRRIPVVKDGKPVGIVSLGDLAIERDPDSVLADISAAAPDGAGAAGNGVASAGTKSAISRALPAAAVGAGLAVTAGIVRNRGKKRSVKVAAKRLRKTGRKLHKSGDRIGSEATSEAAKYAAAAAAELRSRGKKMGKEAEKSARKFSKGAEAKAHDLSKSANRKAKELSKKAEKKAEALSKKAERQASHLRKKNERKAEEIRELVGSGRR